MLLAHGIGGSTDLPIPFTYALIGGASALTLSFVITIVVWKTPRLQPDRVARRLPAPVAALSDDSRIRGVLRLLAVALVVWVGLAAFAGSAEAGRNPLPGFLYVLVWVGLVPASLLLGPFWRVLSPWRTVHRVLFRDRPAPLTLPRWVGVWPGALGLFAFAWLELACSSNGEVWAVRTWLLAYVAVVLIGSAVFGRDWCAAADPFEVYSSLVSNFAIVGRGRDGALAWRNPLDSLGGLVPVPGIVAVVAVLLGSTAFDSFNAFPNWPVSSRTAAHHRPGEPSDCSVPSALWRPPTGYRRRWWAGSPGSNDAHYPVSWCIRSCRSSSDTSSPTTSPISWRRDRPR